MGYSAKTVLVYGIDLNDAQTRKVTAHIEKLIEEKELPPEDTQYCGVDELMNEIDLPWVVMTYDGADSRLGGMNWLSEYDLNPKNPRSCARTFGIDLGADGANMSVAQLLKKGVPKKVVSDWETKVAPLLKKFRITQKPKLMTISQII